jgi:uncharacterized protein
MVSVVSSQRRRERSVGGALLFGRVELDAFIADFAADGLLLGDGAGALISQAANAGGDATRIGGQSFDIEDDSALLAQVRREAFDEAKAKAELYAQASGRGLGQVVSVNESVAAPDFGRSASADSASAVARQVPILSGEQRLSVTASVEWAFS